MFLVSVCVDPSPAFVCHLNRPQSRGSEGIWFPDQSLHTEALLCLICPGGQVFKPAGSSLGSQPPLPPPASLCWNLLVSQPRQGDGFARHRGKAGNPYTCWSNCKIVETFAASISFQKKRIHRGKWPCCRQITSLSTWCVPGSRGAMPTETELMLNI